jgi:hypothetical protein
MILFDRQNVSSRRVVQQLVAKLIRQILRGLVEQERAEDPILVREIMIGSNDEKVLGRLRGARKIGLPGIAACGDRRRRREKCL